MSTRFAGSRHLDERRRRRLAVEAEEPAGDGVGPRGAGSASAQGAATGRVLTHFPLRKLISSRRWKLWSVLFVIALLGGGIVAGGTFAGRPESGLRPDVAALLSSGGPVARTFGGTLLLVAAQFAIVVWWARSRSLRDFGGRYGVWLWASATLVLWAFCHATSTHIVLGETAQWLWPLDLPSGATVYWLAPAAVWLAVVLRVVDQELVECRTSRVALWLAAGTLAAAGGLALLPDLTILGAERATIDTSVSVLGHWLILAGLVHHARHVIYVTPEPPPRLTPLWRQVLRLVGRILGGLRPRRRSRDAEASNQTQAAAVTKRSTASATAGESAAADESTEARSSSRGRRAETRRTPKTTRTRASEASKAEPAAEATSQAAADVIEDETEDSIEPPEHSSARRAVASATPAEPPIAADEQVDAADDKNESSVASAGERSKSASGANVRIDSPPDKDQFKGLSKRERRMLRKQMKDERRAAGRAE